MPKARFDIVTVGDCKADHFVKLDDYKILKVRGGAPKLVLPFGKKIPVTGFHFFCGGNSLNSAVTFARLGLRPAVLTTLGGDTEGSHILEKMRAEKISVELVSIEKNSETDKSLILVAGGERTIFGYHCEKRYKFPSDLSTDWVYLTSLGSEFLSVYKAVGRGIRRKRFRLAYNPGTRQLLDSLAEVRRMIKHADLLFVNLQEAQTITASRTADAKKLLAGLRGLGAEVAVITDGSRGAYASDGARFLKIPAFPAKRVDATGAGDAFASAFTAAIIRGQSIAEALRWGSVNAAGEISQIGVHNGLCYKAQLLQALRKSPRFVAKSF